MYNWNKPSYRADFKKYLESIFSCFKLSSTNLERILQDKHLDKFIRSFTHESYDKINYEFYETLGDVICNAITTWHFFFKYQDFFESKSEQTGIMGGVDILSRLKQKQVSKQEFSSLISKLNVFEWIRRGELTRTGVKTDTIRAQLQEDVLEALVCAIVLVFDEEFIKGSGYHFATLFMENLFGDMKIDFSEESLLDPKTRINNARSEGYLKRLKIPLVVKYITVDLFTDIDNDYSYSEQEKEEEKKKIEETRYISTLNITLPWGATFVSEAKYGMEKKDAEAAAAKDFLDKKLISQMSKLVEANKDKPEFAQYIRTEEETIANKIKLQTRTKKKDYIYNKQHTSSSKLSFKAKEFTPL